MDGSPPRYTVFISYSHTDEAFARWLHRALERYRLPHLLVGREARYGRVPRRIGRVFRDRVDLSAAPLLQAEIERALAASEALVVVCSPRAAASRYVNAEIDFFARLGRGDRIIAALLDGEPQESFPPALLTAGEPLAADFRPDRDDRRGGLLKLIAGLYGLELDDLIRRERIAQRRRTLFATGIAAAMTVLALSAAGAGFVAWQQREAAISARNLAREREALAESRRQEAEAARRAEAEQALQRRAAQRLAEANARAARAERDLAEKTAVRTAESRADLLATLADQQDDPVMATLVALEAWNRPSAPLGGDELVERYLEISDPERAAFESSPAAQALHTKTPDYRRAAARVISGAVRNRELRVFGDFDREGKLWDYHEGRSLLAAVNERGGGRIWKLDDPGRVVDLAQREPASLYHARFSHSGSMIAATSEKAGLYVWSSETGARLPAPFFWREQKRMARFAFSPDDSRIAVGFEDGDVAIAGFGKAMPLVLKAHTGHVWGVRWSRDGTRLITHSSDKTIKTWDTATGGLLQTLTASAIVHQVELSRDERYLLSMEMDRAILWERASGQRLFTFDRHRSDRALSAIAFSPDSRFALTAGADGSIKVYRVADGQEDWGTGCDEGGIRALSFSPAGNLLAAGTGAGTVCVWGLGKSRPLEKFLAQGEDIADVSFTGDGKIVSTSYWNTARLWSLAPVQSPPRTLGGCPHEPDLVAFSPEGTHVLALDRTLPFTCVWRAADQALVFSSDEMSPTVSPFIWAADGESFLALRDGDAVLADLRTGRVLARLPLRRGLAKAAIYSEEKEVILVSSRTGTVAVWDAGLRRPAVTLRQSTGGVVLHAALTADRRMLATVAMGGQVDLWRTATGEHLMRLTGSPPGKQAQVVELAADGRALRVAFSDGSALEWALRGRAGRVERDPAVAPRDVKEEVLRQLWNFSGFLAVAQEHGRIIVANSETRHLLHTVSPGVGGESYVALSPDQRWIAEAPLSGNPRLWHLPEIVSRGAPERVRRLLGKPESRKRVTPVQKALWEAESQRWLHARATREVSRCLTPRERTLLQLGPDPPCWCATKTFPSREQWIAALGRDPFTSPRAGGRRCSPAETAPWKVFAGQR